MVTLCFKVRSAKLVPHGGGSWLELLASLGPGIIKKVSRSWEERVLRGQTTRIKRIAGVNRGDPRTALPRQPATPNKSQQKTNDSFG